ncbi:MAG: PDZ domain-containing protein [Planctomycetaceae bacterium]|nr:PDZ domain-containing protein [Planctomycetaceae bacterium]
MMLRIALAIAGLLLLSSSAMAQELFVSTRGDDSNPGSREKPLATLDKARAMVRSIKRKAPQPITVSLLAGTYYLPQTFKLTAADSGSKDSPVVYRAAEGAKVVISGGRRLELAWKPWKNGIFKAAVPAAKDGAWPFEELFVNGKRQILARYPNYDPKGGNWGGHSADAVGPERVKTWRDPAGGYMHALQRHLWGSQHYVITGVKDGQAVLEGGWQNNRITPPHELYRFVENVLEELDAPGEWYLDRKSGTLYLMPPLRAGKPLDLDGAVVEAPVLETLVELAGSSEKPVEFISFEGLTFTHAARTFMKTREPLLRSDWTIYRCGAVLAENTHDCAIRNCTFDSVGSNAIFVNKHNLRFEASGCHIFAAGASAICFVGSPKAVREAEYNFDHAAAPRMDRMPGPKADLYPAQCRAHDNLIHDIGVFEKQVAGVQIAMAEEITVSHNSIYRIPRAGINIGDGCWGGHVLEFNDVFDTVLETGDHGSFNSWGRDRFWPKGPAEMSLWDARKTTIIRNNRFRCDHGWDIDLDDGSSNYHIYNNLCLHGGLKLREGYYRTAENNIMVDNSFHPHVWFANSGDVFRRNIVFAPYKPIHVAAPWGKEVDNNLLHAPRKKPTPWTKTGSGRDKNSLTGDAMFVDPASGDYRVKEGSPAMKLGFKNFPMDQFGVVSPALKAQASTPRLPAPARAGADEEPETLAWMGATARPVKGYEILSSLGRSEEIGVALTKVPEDSAAAKAGFAPMDVILKISGKPVNSLTALTKAAPPGKTVTISLRRRSGEMMTIKAAL